MKGFRVVKVDQVAGKVRTVVSYQIEPLLVWVRIKLSNQSVVLVFASVQLKSIDGSAVSSPNQFRPTACRGFALRTIRRNGLEMVTPILIAEKVDELWNLVREEAIKAFEAGERELA